MSQEVSLALPRVMLNVGDVVETIRWYQSIGFTLATTNQEWEPDSPINWAQVKWDEAEIMLNADDDDGGVMSGFKLFFDTNDVDGLYRQIHSFTKVIYEPLDQFYGRRDFEVEDINGVRLVFGQGI